MEKRLNNLQVLRAFAAISIVLAHSITPAENYGFKTHYMHRFAEFGANGVIFFFVLSGFILVYVQRHVLPSPLKFFCARLTRVAPIYWILTLSLLLITYLFPKLFLSGVAGYEDKAAASLIFMSQFLMGEYPVLYVGWTIEYEMLFYVLMGLGLMLGGRALAYPFVGVSLIMISLIFPDDLVVLEFLFGIILGLIYTKLKMFSALSIMSLLIGIGLILMDLIYKPYAGSLDHHLFRYGVPAFFVIYGLLGIPQITLGLLTSIGDGSYSIYLIQVFTIPIFFKVIKMIGVGIYLSNDLLAVVCVIFTVVIGMCAYRYIEKPISSKMRNFCI